MGIMASFAKGFLADQVESRDARAKFLADQRATLDRINAEKVANMEIRENDLRVQNLINLENEENDKNKRIEILRKRGFSDDYINTLIPLDSSANMYSYLNDKKTEWGGAENWNMIQLVHGPEWAKGMSVQDYELAKFSKAQNTNNFASNVETNNGVSNNVANFTIGTKSGTGDSQSANEDSYNWSNYELLNGKLNAITKVEGTYINPQGQIVTAYHTETKPGSNVYGSPYVTVMGQEGSDAEHISLQKLINDGGFIPRFSAQGENYYFNNNPTIDSVTSNQSFMLTHPNTQKHYSFSGYTENFKGNQKPITYITGMEPALANEFGLTNDLKMDASVPFGGADFTGMDKMPANITMSQLLNKGFVVSEQNVDKLLTSRAPAPGLDFTKTLDFNRLSKNSVQTVYPQFTDSDFRNVGLDAEGETIFQFDTFGKNKNVTNSIAALNLINRDANNQIRLIGKNNQSIPGNIVSLLDLPSKNPNDISNDMLNDKIAIAFRDLKNSLKTNYLNRLNAGEDFTADKTAAGIEKDVTENAEIAEELANFEMSSASSFLQLLIGVENQKVKTAQAQEDAEVNTQSVIDKYFFTSNEQQGLGSNSFEDEVISLILPEYIENGKLNKAPLIEQLNTQIVSLTGDASSTDGAILMTEAKRIVNSIIDGTGPITLEELANRKGGSVTSLSKEQWLSNNKVQTADEIGSIAEWRKTYGYKPEDSLLIIYDHDAETGYKFFVNPKLPANQVEPRPKGASFPKGGYTRWDRLWSATHNSDGTLKF